jgi:PAP2 superfamily
MSSCPHIDVCRDGPRLLEVGQAGRRSARALRRLTAAGWRREALAFLCAYLVYELARSLGTGGTPTALANAHRVLGAERALGLDIEGRLQRALSGTPWMSGLNWLYLGAQSLALAAGVIFVYRRSRPVYRVLRGTVITTWMITLPVYALFPTAPPRLAGIGLADTVSNGTAVSLDSHTSTLFYNPYAAVPSLHAGFAFALGLAVAAAGWGPIRLAGLLWGPLVALAVLATGNHFVLDIAAGLSLTLIGLGLSVLLTRAGERVRSRRVAPRSERASAPPEGVGARTLPAARATADGLRR